MRSLTLIVAVSALLASAARGHHEPLIEDDPQRAALVGVALTGRDVKADYGLINLLIETGRRAPEQNLLQLDAVRRISLRIEGPAQFYYRAKDDGQYSYVRRVTYRADMVRLPSVTPGSDKESFLFVEVAGDEPWDPIRVAVLEKNLIHDYWLSLETALPLILRLDERAGYVLADMSRVDLEKVRADGERLNEGSLLLPAPLPGGTSYLGSGLPWYFAGSRFSTTEPSSLPA